MAVLYKVQSGAFKNAVRAYASAAAVRKKVEKYFKKKGKKETVSVAVVYSNGYYKVQEGAFASKENAEKRKELLRKADVYSVVVETKTQDSPAPKAEEEKPHRIRVVALAFFDTGDESKQYGDCTAIIEYGDDDKTVEHAVLIDTGMSISSPNIIRKLKALGVKKLDAIVISHAHGDHYGGASNIIWAIPTAEIYVPDPTVGLDKYHQGYGNALRSQYKKAKGHYIKTGSKWDVGGIHFECIYQCNAASLKEHDTHHFINNMSVVLRVSMNGWVMHAAGDMQNEGNNLLVKAVKNLKCDIFKCQWHGDANACNEAICRALKPLIAFMNYHHKERSGRGTTRKRLEAVGAVVARNHENGDIYIDCLPGSMKLTCSKGNLSKTFQRKAAAWNYKVSLTTKLYPPQSGLIVIEPEDYTMAEIKALKKSGAKVLAYLSIGSVSDERTYYKQLKPYQLKRLKDWPHERYIDLRRPEVREWVQKKAKQFKGAGFDGCWCDNVDLYEEYKSTEMFNAITATLQAIKAVGGYVMINGGMAYLTDLLIPHKVQMGAYEKKENAAKMKKQLKAKNFPAVEVEMDGLRKIQSGAFSTQENADQLVKKLHDAGFETAKRITLFSGKASAFIDGVTQEEVFSLIKDYEKKDKDSGKKGIFGNQKKEQSESYQSHIRRLIKAGIAAFLLEYTRSNTLKLRIRAFCITVGAVAYISDDVDL